MSVPLVGVGRGRGSGWTHVDPRYGHYIMTQRSSGSYVNMPARLFMPPGVDLAPLVLRPPVSNPTLDPPSISEDKATPASIEAWKTKVAQLEDELRLQQAQQEEERRALDREHADERNAIDRQHWKLAQDADERVRVTLSRKDADLRAVYEGLMTAQRDANAYASKLEEANRKLAAVEQEKNHAKSECKRLATQLHESEPKYWKLLDEHRELKKHVQDAREIKAALSREKEEALQSLTQEHQTLREALLRDQEKMRETLLQEKEALRDSLIQEKNVAMQALELLHEREAAFMHTRLDEKEVQIQELMSRTTSQKALIDSLEGQLLISRRLLQGMKQKVAELKKTIEAKELLSYRSQATMTNSAPLMTEIATQTVTGEPLVAKGSQKNEFDIRADDSPSDVDPPAESRCSTPQTTVSPAESHRFASAEAFGLPRRSPSSNSTLKATGTVVQFEIRGPIGEEEDSDLEDDRRTSKDWRPHWQLDSLSDVLATWTMRRTSIEDPSSTTESSEGKVEDLSSESPVMDDATEDKPDAPQGSIAGSVTSFGRLFGQALSSVGETSLPETFPLTDKGNDRKYSEASTMACNHFPSGFETINHSKVYRSENLPSNRTRIFEPKKTYRLHDDERN